MYKSLEKLQKLPSNTLVYSAHEYTLANLEFAEQVEQENQDISEYIHLCHQKIKDGFPTLPSSLEIEHRINPFMRCADSDLRQAIAKNMKNSKTATDAEIFSYLREWKDSF
jgi:hydroxyacylglutathione hydrolase